MNRFAAGARQFPAFSCEFGLQPLRCFSRRHFQRASYRDVRTQQSNYRAGNITKRQTKCSTRIEQSRGLAEIRTGLEDAKLANRVHLDIDGASHAFSPILLRDLDDSSENVDPSTKQKYFATTEISPNIRALSVTTDEEGVTIQWDGGLLGENDSSFIRWSTLRRLAKSGLTDAPSSSIGDLPNRILWTADQVSNGVHDIDYEAYMRDDRVLLDALLQLHEYGIIFLKNVPELESSASTIAERIGPSKNTLYGNDWDVRSVPEAKNVANTSQDLGFHMDLLYLHQPPHLQLLHCIRSSSAGGASLFSDAYKCAADLLANSSAAFVALSNLEVNFHYNHEASQLYRQNRRVFELAPVYLGGIRLNSFEELTTFLGVKLEDDPSSMVELLDAVNWSPPFQAPFALPSTPRLRLSGQISSQDRIKAMSRRVDEWHAAARAFSAFIHHPDNVYERMMQPGECVIFNNRRVLHARRAFDVDDVGKERWLRGTYMDKDPYISKLSVLQHRFLHGRSNS